jgi:hypothetical protein
VNNLLNEVSDLATDPDDDAPWRTEPPDALEG